MFQELGVLLHSSKLEIVMVGVELSKKVHGKVTEKRNLKITTMKGRYHSLTLPKPNIIIGREI